MPPPFGPWNVWRDAPPFNAVSLAETLDGGQAFRWRRNEDFFEGRWGRYVVRLRYAANQLQYAVSEGVDTEGTQRALQSYFAGTTDFGALTDALPWRSDPVLATAVEHFRGLRILHQPFAETLFCFLCSSTKQITQIKSICETVARDLGEPLPDGSHALPDWATIAEAGESRLRAAKLGYRARYIHQTAQFLADRPDWLDQTETAPTETARSRLLELPGVGRKIADCVLLFGAGRLEAFPIDTWIEKILIRAYQLEGWKLPQLQDFARIHFGGTSGYAQQYLFAAARAGILTSLSPVRARTKH